MGAGTGMWTIAAINAITASSLYRVLCVGGCG